MGICLAVVFLLVAAGAPSSGADAHAAGADADATGADASAAETFERHAGQQLAPPLEEMDELLSMPLEAFLERRSEASSLLGPAEYDWSSDGCTTFISTIPAAAQRWLDTFEPACERHDWGYRNFGSINRRGYDATEERRREVDEQLRSDMHSLCDDLAEESLTCRVVAEAIYRAVRVGGHLSFYGFFESPEVDTAGMSRE